MQEKTCERTQGQERTRDRERKRETMRENTRENKRENICRAYNTLSAISVCFFRGLCTFHSFSFCLDRPLMLIAGCHLQSIDQTAGASKLEEQERLHCKNQFKLFSGHMSNTSPSSYQNLVSSFLCTLITILRYLKGCLSRGLF